MPHSARKKKGPEKGNKLFSVVGIGASAGGLEAISTLLQNIPADNGIAYIVIQHLSADRESSLPEILQRQTKMPVQTVKDGIQIAPDNVYVIPPDTYMEIAGDELRLSQREAVKVPFHPIDKFLTSLADTYQNRAIGIILSGTATDGTIGLKSIKTEGGITFAQDNSAKFSGMPQSAIESGQVDFILSPEKIAKELEAIVRSPFISQPPDEILERHRTDLEEIIHLLYKTKRVDFSLYKPATINRRIIRRVALHKMEDIKEYVSLVKEDEHESDLLFNDLLINVTSFFRDPLVFTALSETVFPLLVKNRNKNDTIRMWVTACSTGEEAYSIAISLSEYLSANALPIPFQVFATDVSERVIEKARKGVFPNVALEQLPSEEMKKYFIKIDNEHFQVTQAIKDVCVFAKHNLLTDPPFSRVDIVFCQNLLIYMNPDSQFKILQSFHYALKANGFLLLGKSESIGETTNLFEHTAGQSKIFTKKNVLSHLPFNFSLNTFQSSPHEDRKIDYNNLPSQTKESKVEIEIDRMLLSRYVTPSVLINKDMHIIRFNGTMSDYLQPSGKASFHLLKIIKDEFLIDLRTLVSLAKNSSQTEKKEGIRFVKNGMVYYITLEIVPVSSSSSDPYFLILFKEQSFREDVNSPLTKKGPTQKTNILQKELLEATEQIKMLTREFDISREELQSSNEEVISSNEELQSINEELETSKEELQSTNEELVTINDELIQRNNELNEASEYREAIVETIREPLIVLNTEMQVLTANKAFYAAFEIPGSEIEGLNFYKIGDEQWNISSLKDQLNDIIFKKTNFKNFEIYHSFPKKGMRTILFNAMRMGDDSTKRNKIVLVIEDISEKREAEEELKNSHKKNLKILNSITDLFIALNNKWQFTFINKEAEQFFDKKMDDIIGHNIWEIMPSYAGTDFYKHLVHAMKTKEFTEFEFFDDRISQWYNYRLFPTKDVFTIYADNITEHKRAAELVLQSRERYQTFISKSAEGILRFEIEKPISFELRAETQLTELLKNSSLAECNDIIAQMFGYSKAADIEGISLEKLFAGSQLMNHLPEFISSGYSLTDVVTNEKSPEGKDTFYLNNLVGIVEKNLLKRIWGTKRDITEQKKTEISLKETQQRLNMSLSAGLVSTWLWKISENKIEWKEELKALYGLNDCPSECSFEDWIKLVNGDDAILVQQKIKDAVHKKKEINVEFRVLWPDESVHWILFKCIPTYDENGNPSQLIGVNIDITDRKLLEKERESFIAITSHELKTPLTSIKAYAEILHEKLISKKDEDSASLAQKMEGQIDRLHNLIKDLLDVTKIDEGQLQLNPSYFDFNELLTEVVEEMQNTTKTHKIITEEQAAIQIWADKNKIREVLINFISNAIKYSPLGHEVIIRSTKNEKDLVVCVKDFGIGLSKNNRTKLFTRFYRVNDATVNTFPGLGLGLYISSEIIKRHHGTVWVESIKGKGSEFYFSLPLITP